MSSSVDMSWDQVEELMRDRGSEVPVETIQRILTLGVKLYAAKVEQEETQYAPFDQQVSATEVMIAVTSMLKAADVELFELGLWQSWK